MTIHILMQCLIPILIVYELKGGHGRPHVRELNILLTRPSFGTSSFNYDLL